MRKYLPNESDFISYAILFIFLFMAIGTSSLFSLMSFDFMTFPFFTAGHLSSVGSES